MGTSGRDIDLLDAGAFERMEHHEWFRRLRAEDPLFWFEEAPGHGFWNALTHADVVAVGRDSGLYSSAVGGTQIYSRQHSIGSMDNDPGAMTRGVIMLEMDPPKHTRYRLLVNKGFTPRMVGLLEDALRVRATHIVDRVIERGEADFVVDIASELPLQAIAEIMGVPQEDRMKLFDWSNRMIGAGDPEFMGEDLQLAVMEIFSYSNDLAAERRVEPRDDIVTKLLGAEIDGDHLTELEFDMFMLLLTVAGNETTRNATAAGMHALLTNPDQMAVLRRDPDGAIDAAVEEILRWSSPVMHFKRTLTADTELHGRTLHAGDSIVMWYVSANRDEAVFDDPYTFDVSRDPNPQVAFGGGGTHFCLGANLARMELRLILHELVTRMPDLRLAGEPARLHSNFIGGIKHMPVTWTPGPRVRA